MGGCRLAKIVWYNLLQQYSNTALYILQHSTLTLCQIPPRPSCALAARARLRTGGHLGAWVARLRPMTVLCGACQSTKVRSSVSGSATPMYIALCGAKIRRRQSHPFRVHEDVVLVHAHTTSRVVTALKQRLPEHLKQLGQSRLQAVTTRLAHHSNGDQATKNGSIELGRLVAARLCEFGVPRAFTGPLVGGRPCYWFIHDDCALLCGTWWRWHCCAAFSCGEWKHRRAAAPGPSGHGRRWRSRSHTVLLPDPCRRPD